MNLNISNENGYINKKYTCDGDKISPSIKWNTIINKNTKRGAKSYCLTIIDMDVNYIHWIIPNINIERNEIQENENIKSGLNTKGTTKYIPPCPPNEETHRYAFTLYTLNIILDNNKIWDLKELLSEIKNHILNSDTIILKYKRNNNYYY